MSHHSGNGIAHTENFHVNIITLVTVIGKYEGTGVLVMLVFGNVPSDMVNCTLHIITKRYIEFTPITRGGHHTTAPDSKTWKCNYDFYDN